MRRLPPGFPSVAGIALAMLVPLAAIVVFGWSCRLSWPRTFDGPEAQLAINVGALANGAPLYSEFRVPPYGVPQLYGPVVPCLTVPLLKLFGSNPIAPLEAGRTLTICASIAICLLIFQLARRSDAGAAAAAVCALAFLLSPLLDPWGFAFRVDMVALAFDLGGLALLDADRPLAGLPMFVIAFFAKQMRVAGIGAGVLHLWLNGKRKNAVILGASWLAAVAGVTAVLRAAFPYYWLNNYGALAPFYSFSFLLYMLSLLAVIELPILQLAGAEALNSLPRPGLTVCFLAAALAQDTALGIRVGSNMYYFLTTVAAGSIVAAPQFDRLQQRANRLTMPARLAIGLAVPLLIVSELSVWSALTGHPFPFEIGAYCSAAARRKPVWDAESMRRLGSIQGRVLTDVPELALIKASRQIEFLDLLPLDAMRVNGSFDDAPLLDAIRRRQIAAFALDSDLLNRAWAGRAWFWPELREAIEQNYVVVRSAGPPILAVPRPEPAK